MKNIALFLFLLIGFAQCKNDAKQDGGSAGSNGKTSQDMPGMDHFRGLLMQNQGKTGMLDPLRRKIYLVKDSTGTIDEVYQKATGILRYNSEPVFAVLTGKYLKRTTPGIEEFVLYRIDSMLAKTPELVTSVGAPFEFWCHGTNPNWEVEISQFEGGIFYENQGDGTAWCCQWGAPKETETTWTYNVAEIKDFSGPMTINIKKEKATDGTSSKEYDYSVEISAKGKTYKGVAIRGTGLTQVPVATKK